GLRPDVWDEFQRRFRIPRILEFYASTEGNVSLFNIDGKPGAIGRIPSFLAHRVPVTLVKFDVETGEPVRNEQGFCLRCAPNAVVYGVTVPGTEGRAGMAAVVVGPPFDLTAFRLHLARLPEYARPLFLRVRGEIETTATFKRKAWDLSREGYDPVAIGDAIYFNDAERGAFVRLDKALYDRIQTGQVRL